MVSNSSSIPKARLTWMEPLSILSKASPVPVSKLLTRTHPGRAVADRLSKQRARRETGLFSRCPLIHGLRRLSLRRALRLQSAPASHQLFRVDDRYPSADRLRIRRLDRKFLHFRAT